jgi:hypothetical protein
MRRSRILLLSACVVSALWPSTLLAADGVLLVQSVSDGAKTTATSSQVHLEPTRIRTEVHDGDGRRQVIIFNGATEVLYIIDPARKSYMEMTRADAAKMGSMMSGAMTLMQQQLANLPPAQRAMMEQKMAGMMGGATSVARPEYKRVGTGKVGDRTCDRYDGYSAGRKTSEICTVSPDALGFSLADFGVLGKLSDFVRTIMPQLGDQIVGVGTPELGFSGLPIRTATTDPRSGRTITMQMTEARRATFEDAIFQVPAGFTKQTIPMMGQ